MHTKLFSVFGRSAFALSLGLMVGGVGCATSTRALKSEMASGAAVAQVSEIKAIRPPAGAATIVLYKKNAFASMFGPIRMQSNVFLDEVPSGDLSDYQYAVLHVKPGRHSLRTFAAIQGTNFSATKIVEARAGEVLFVELQKSQGWNSAGVKLEPKETAHDAIYEEVATCKFAFDADLSVGKAQ